LCCWLAQEDSGMQEQVAGILPFLFELGKETFEALKPSRLRSLLGKPSEDESSDNGEQNFNRSNPAILSDIIS